MIGAFGDKIFSVSAETVRSFEDFSRSIGLKYATHEIIHNKSALEPLNLELEDLTFRISLYENMGLDINNEIKDWLDILKNKEAHLLTIGGELIGSGYFLLTDLDVSYNKIDNKGNTLSASLGLSLKEYVIYDTHAKEVKAKQNVIQKELE